MKWYNSKVDVNWWLSGLVLIGLIAAAGTQVPLSEAQGQEHGPEEVAKLLKYPDGTKLLQKYRKPEVANVPVADGVVDVPRLMSAATDTPSIGQAGLKLRQRTVVQLSAERDSALKVGVSAADAFEQVTSIHFDVGVEPADQPAAERRPSFIPITKASQTFVVVNGKAILVRDRNLPPAGFKAPPVKPAVPFEKARDTALAQAREVVKKLYPRAEPVLVADSHESEKPELQVYLTNERKAGRLAWRFSIASTNPTAPFLRRFWMAADREQAEPLDFEDRVYLSSGCRDCNESANSVLDRSRLVPWPVMSASRLSLEHASFRTWPAASAHFAMAQKEKDVRGTSGTIIGTIWKESPHFGGTVKVPLSGITVVVSKGATQVSVQTNADGKYFVAQLSGNVKVSATLAGPQCRIVNDASPSATVLTRTKFGTGQIDLDFTEANNPEAALAQVSAFHGINTAFEFTRPYLPANPSFLANMRTTVMINDECNANYSPADHSTNFFHTIPGSCANTAYLDVVAHEYGHAVDDQLGGIQDGGYSEGTGDMLCLLITRQSAVGRDFRKPPQGMNRFHLRDATKAPLWPTVQGSGVHQKGWAYSGFCWKLITGLQKTYQNDEVAFSVAKQLLLGAAANNPSSVPDAVRTSFFIDAQLFPGTVGQNSKHFNELKAAATGQQIPIPDQANPADLTVGQ